VAASGIVFADVAKNQSTVTAWRTGIAAMTSTMTDNEKSHLYQAYQLAKMDQQTKRLYAALSNRAKAII